MKIGEIAKITGLSVETIRYYETEGIVLPTRDDVSGYRQFELWDLFYVVECLFLRNLGMSVKESAKFIRQGTLEDMLDHIKRKRISLKEEINKKCFLEQ